MKSETNMDKNCRVFLQKDGDIGTCSLRTTSAYDCEDSRGFRKGIDKIHISAYAGVGNNDNRHPVFNAYRHIKRNVGTTFQVGSIRYGIARTMIEQYRDLWGQQRANTTVVRAS